MKNKGSFEKNQRTRADGWGQCFETNQMGRRWMNLNGTLTYYNETPIDPVRKEVEHQQQLRNKVHLLKKPRMAGVAGLDGNKAEEESLVASSSSAKERISRSSYRNRFLTCLTKGEQMLNFQFNNITAIIIIINDHHQDLFSVSEIIRRLSLLLRHIRARVPELYNKRENIDPKKSESNKKMLSGDVMWWNQRMRVGNPRNNYEKGTINLDK